MAASSIPVISAVGHETDFTICDFAADLRAPTPSAAAELAVPDRAELRVKINTLAGRSEAALPRMIAERRKTIARLAASRIMSNPARLTEDRKIELDGLADALGKAGDRKLSTLRDRVRSSAAHLEALSPLSVLSRGYAVVTGKDGAAITDASGLMVGESVNIKLKKGSAGAKIEKIEVL